MKNIMLRLFENYNPNLVQYSDHGPNHLMIGQDLTTILVHHSDPKIVFYFQNKEQSEIAIKI